MLDSSTSNGTPQALPLTTRVFQDENDRYTAHVLVGDRVVATSKRNTNATQARDNAIDAFVQGVRKATKKR